MSEHTPGPWTAAPCSRAGYWIAVDKHPFSVVATLDEEGRYGAIEGDNAEANARLIAQSPVLLALVEEGIDLWNSPNWRPSQTAINAWLTRAQHAVAKARGGER